MLKMITLALCLMGLGFSAGAADESEQTQVDDTLFYTSTLGTVGEALTQLGDFGFLNRDEKAAITSFLTSKKVSLESKLTPGKRSGKTIAFGKLKFEMLPGPKIKTADGQIFAFTKGETADHFFIAMFTALDKKQASNWSPLPYAFAEEGFFDQLGAAIGFTAQKIFQVPLTATMGAGAVVLAAPSMVIAGGLNLVYKGRVSCRGSDYYVDQGYADFYGKRLISLSMTYSASRHNPSEPHVAAAFGAGGEFLNKILSGDREIKYILPDAFTDAFHGHRVPKCNKRSRLIAQNYLRAHAKSDLVEIADMIRNVKFGSGGSEAPAGSAY